MYVVEFHAVECHTTVELAEDPRHQPIHAERAERVDQPAPRVEASSLLSRRPPRGPIAVRR
jgi:hypothetical protein